MQEFIATGDFHAKPLGEFSRHCRSDGGSLLSDLILKTAGWIKQHVTSDSFLLLNGDYTDSPGMLDAPTIKLLKELELVWGEMSRVLNIGNHDLSTHGGAGLHNLLLHGVLSNFIQVPQYGKTWRRGDLWVVPYTPEIGHQEDMIGQIPDGAVVAIHYPVMGTHLTPPIGDLSILEQSGLDPAVFCRFRLTILSHYHTPQIIGDVGAELISEEGEYDLEWGSILCLGTPLAHSFSDNHSTYGIWQVRIPDIANMQATAEFIPNPHSPRYLTLKVDSQEQLREKINGIEGPVFLSIKTNKAVGEEIRATKIEGPRILGRRIRIQREEKERGGDRVSLSMGEILPSIRKYAEHDIDAFRGFPVEEVCEYLRPIIEKTVMEDAMRGNVTFLSLSICNFLSWREASVEFGGSGVTLVHGINADAAAADSNGSGKTSLLEAIVWAVYGRLYRQLEKIDDVIRHGADFCSSSFEFVAGGVRYKIDRFRKCPNRGTGVQFWTIGDNGWIDISRTRAPDTDKFILQVWGVPFEVFSSTIFFSSQFHGRFSRMGDAEKKRFLGSIFGAKNYETIRKFVSVDYQNKRRESDRYEAQQETLQKSVERHRESVQLESIIAKRREKEIDRELSTLEKRRIDQEADLKRARDSSEKARDALNQYTMQHDTDVQKAADLVSRKQSLSISRCHYSDQVHRIQKWRNTKELSLDLVEKSLDSVEKICPECGQDLPKESVDQVRKRIQDRILEQQGDIEKLLEQEREALERAAETDQKIKQVEEEIGSTEEQLSKYREEKASYEASLAVAQEWAIRSQRELHGIEVEMGTLREEDPYLQVRALRATLSDEENRLEETKNRAADAARTVSMLEVVHQILGPKAILSFLLDSVLIEINSFLAYISPTLFEDDFTVRLSPTKDLQKGGEQNTIVTSITTAGGSYGTASDGEQVKADIAIHLALSSLLSRSERAGCNVLIGDQVFDNSLDRSAARSVIETLKLFAEEEKKRVFLISHSPGLSSFVEDSLTIEKKDGISRLL